MKPFKIFIFSNDEESFLQRQSSPEFFGIEKVRIVWADSSKFSRQHFINSYLNEWLFFMDHDCFPGANTFSVIESIIQSQEDNQCAAVAGRYENPTAASLLQRAHNFIANGWVEHSFLHGEGVLLGGIFLVYSTEQVQNSSISFWGAEDKALSYQLRKQGFKLRYQPDFKVVHSTSRSFLHFVRRAWLHGINDVRYVPQGEGPINFPYWLRKAALSNLNLVPLIVLHFCIQKAARLLQTVRPANK